LEASQLRFCQRTNLRYCPIFDAVGKGTAFLVENDRQIFSVLHNFNDFFGVQIQKQDLIDRNEIRKVIRNIPIPMLMTRNDESLAFTSKDNTALMDLFNPDTRLFDVKFGNNAFMFKLSDLVSLNVASAMPDRPLKIATRLPEVGDVVYGLGYPRKTKDRHSTFGTEDSDGKQIWVSKGHVISTAEWARRIDPDMPPLVKLAYDAYMIMTDFDVEHGDSGGPILNEQGEVVGVIQAMYPDLTTPHQILSGGLKIFSEPKLNKLWDMFQ